MKIKMLKKLRTIESFEWKENHMLISTVLDWLTAWANSSRHRHDYNSASNRIVGRLSFVTIRSCCLLILCVDEDFLAVVLGSTLNRWLIDLHDCRCCHHQHRHRRCRNQCHPIANERSDVTCCYRLPMYFVLVVAKCLANPLANLIPCPAGLNDLYCGDVSMVHWTLQTYCDCRPIDYYVMMIDSILHTIEQNKNQTNSIVRLDVKWHGQPKTLTWMRCVWIGCGYIVTTGLCPSLRKSFILYTAIEFLAYSLTTTITKLGSSRTSSFPFLHQL